MTNTASGTITGYAVDRGGKLLRLQPDDGATGVSGGNPLDAAVFSNTMFVLTPQNGSIVTFSIEGAARLSAGLRASASDHPRLEWSPGDGVPGLMRAGADARNGCSTPASKAGQRWLTSL